MFQRLQQVFGKGFQDQNRKIVVQPTKFFSKKKKQIKQNRVCHIGQNVFGIMLYLTTRNYIRILQQRKPAVRHP